MNLKYFNNSLNLQVNELSPGKYFGELALVHHAPRQATVVARDDVKVACECFLISGNYLTHYCSESIVLLYLFATQLVLPHINSLFPSPRCAGL